MKVLLAALLVLYITGCINTITPGTASRQDVQGLEVAKTSKSGSDCTLQVLFLLGPFGNASVVNAAKAGGVSRVSFVDYRTENFILAQRFCVVAYGE